MNSAGERAARLIKDLARELDQPSGALALHYMPTVDLASSAVTGAEALARWEHPEFGAVPPSYFVPLAELHGFASRLGLWVRNRAATDALGGPLAAGKVAVNVSAAELADPGLADGVLDLLERTGLPAGRLCVEVTETAVASNSEAAIEALTRLRAAGIGIALDDFGTGHASLSYLARLPCTIVKIDRSFVSGLGVDDCSRAIVAGVIAMAHAVGHAVIAEGVETGEQRRLLLDLGCEEGQGYLFGKATPLRALTARRRQPAVPQPREASHPRLSPRLDLVGGQPILDLARDLPPQATLQEALALVFRALRPFVAFTGGSVQLLGPDGIRLAAAHPPPTAEALGARIPAGQGVGGAIIATGHLRYLPDITVPAEAVSASRRKLSTTRHTRSYLGVPIIVAGRPVGVLQIDSVEPHAFDRDAELAMVALASLLVPIVERGISPAKGIPWQPMMVRV